MYWVRGETLGKGGSAFVSKAETHQESKDTSSIPHLIAIKTAKASESGSLSKEKELLNKFKNCQFIIRCFGDEFTTENNKEFYIFLTENNKEFYNIFLEYASGGCLFDRIVNNKGMPEPLVRKYTRSILTAPSHVHKEGYVHCDVKPHNILLVQEDGYHGHELAKLADFGTAKRIKNFDETKEDDRFHGTYMYAAPESIVSIEYGPKSDIWALGCTVLHMLTGKSPWKLDNKKVAIHFLYQIGVNNEIPKISKNLSPEAKDFLRKCLVQNPRARFSADTLLGHPFLNIKTESSSHHHHHGHHRWSSRLHSIVPHCFHIPNIVHAS